MRAQRDRETERDRDRDTERRTEIQRLTERETETVSLTENETEKAQVSIPKGSLIAAPHLVGVLWLSIPSMHSKIGGGGRRRRRKHREGGRGRVSSPSTPRSALYYHYFCS